ncbi:pentapeptide repeat-containing protein [Streptomyces sp. NPDC005322]|uniref:pentapeptide repeat-containing protein n=1 Tax=Streptomyces sp. NPDC005322 TaxID=3157032 RepID=UPI0033A9F1F0
MRPSLNRRPARMRSLPWHITLVLVLGAGVFALTATLLWAALGFPALTGPHALAAGTKFDLVKLALSVVAGVGGVLALVVAYRRQRLSEAAERREDIRLFNERFITASSQLGHELPTVRLAGIYAMAGLADDWAEGRQSCVNVLSAYLRMPYEPVSTSPWYLDEEGEIRLSLTRLITEHLREDAPVSWQGCDFDFTRARFQAADFSGACFSGGEVSFSLVRFDGGRISFDGARFSGSRVRFGGTAFLGGQVSFADACFSEGRVTFDGAVFTGAAVSFRGARFTGAELDLSSVEPENYAVPPEFDPWDTPPAGLLLPRPRTSG